MYYYIYLNAFFTVFQGLGDKRIFKKLIRNLLLLRLYVAADNLATFIKIKFYLITKPGRKYFPASFLLLINIPSLFFRLTLTFSYR